MSTINFACIANVLKVFYSNAQLLTASAISIYTVWHQIIRLNLKITNFNRKSISLILDFTLKYFFYLRFYCSSHYSSSTIYLLFSILISSFINQTYFKLKEFLKKITSKYLYFLSEILQFRVILFYYQKDFNLKYLSQ